MSVLARLSALRARMAATGTDLIALGPGPNMHWALGFHTHPDERPCLLMVTADKAGFLMPYLNAADARARPVHVPEDIGCARFRGRGDAEEGRGDHQGRAGENSTRMTPVWHKRTWWGRSRGYDLIPSLIPVPSFQQ